MTRRSQQYPPELRERAVRMVAEVTPNYDSQWAAINAVAQKLGVGTAELKRLRREVAELRRANEILEAASAFFAPCPIEACPHRSVAPPGTPRHSAEPP